MKSRRITWIVLGVFLFASACTAGKPATVISSPPSGSQYHESDEVAIQSTSADTQGVTRVELTIDGAVMRNDTPPSPQTSFSIIQTWKATAGPHTIIVRAYNAAGATSDPAAIAISVEAAGAPTSPPTATAGKLSGQVMYTGAMSQPAANAKVVLVDMPTISITAGSDGRYVLSNVPAGAHVVSASTNQGSCNPMSVNVPAGGTASADLAILTAFPTATLQAAAPCTDNEAFVKDVTIPDGTSLAPGAAFSKSWLVRNSGTCAWTTAYDLAFVSGEAMAATTSIAVPKTAPGETAELIVPMIAPTSLGVHNGVWKLRNVGDASFGGGLTVKINVSDPNAPAQPPAQPPVQPPATGCTGTPNIESFTAAATTINGGQSTTLNWGAVTGADSVEIDNGIGGVPAPGSATVSPGAKTTYTLSAHCGSNTKTAQVTINVQVLAPPVFALPDLYVSEFSLDPSPPHKSQVAHVRIGVYNQGNAASGSFKVEWWAGSNYPGPAKTWTIGSMSAHGGQILTYDYPANSWGSWYSSITTRVKIDVDGSVTESNEGNNIFDKNISVSP